MMYTQAQIRTIVYDALQADSALTTVLSDRITWIARPTKDDDFPDIVYNILDGAGSYAFSSVPAIFDEYTFQIDAISDPGDVTSMDTMVERIKVVMESLGFMNLEGSIEFLEDEINKIVRPTRWEITNT